MSIDSCGGGNSHGNREHVDAEALQFSDAAQSLSAESEKLACCMDDSFNFKCFDITKDRQDHYFLGANEQVYM